ncbi:MAG TPA: hypothetical protein V6C97_01810 [Oculatellaceae cyanobacterium]
MTIESTHIHSKHDNKTEFDPAHSCTTAKELAELSPHEAYRALKEIAKNNPNYWVATQADTQGQSMQLMNEKNDDVLGLRYDKNNKNEIFSCKLEDY